MKERPILFSGTMVRAILEGRKTQTRRVCKPQPDETKVNVRNIPAGFLRHPWNGVDRLWVRETWQAAKAEAAGPSECIYRADGTELPHGWMSWHPSIFMPRWASRITLEVTAVRVQRLQEISEWDAQAEGLDSVYAPGIVRYRPLFADLWDSLNAKRAFGWDANPWVWAITFRRVQ